MSYELTKLTLVSSIEKIIWNLRITIQPSINRIANTKWKNLISIDNRLDQGKSIKSDRRAKNWELHDGVEDGYEDAVKDSSSDSDIPLAKISHGSRTTPIPTSHRKQPTFAELTTGGNRF